MGGNALRYTERAVARQARGIHHENTAVVGFGLDDGESPFCSGCRKKPAAEARRAFPSTGKTAKKSVPPKKESINTYRRWSPQ